MRALLAWIDNLLAELCDRRLAQPPRAYTTLAPVWVMPMATKAECPVMESENLPGRELDASQP